MTRRATVEEQLAVLMRGTQYGDPSLRATMEDELRERLREGRPLRVYVGIDPTATVITLGHTVPLRKLRQFQEMGHHCVFLIGNFTGLAGDTSDKLRARALLDPETLERNAATYTEQAVRILDPQITEVRRNAEWLSKLSFAEVIRLASQFTISQFLERETWRARVERRDPIYVHELFYPLMQGYDAVALRADVQIGGSEQLFNLMAGRTLQRAHGQRPQVCVTMPILIGTDGHLRMSKTTGNYIAVTDPPAEMYGKVMSVPDHLILHYYELVTSAGQQEIDAARAGLAAENPMGWKKRLAYRITCDFYGAEAALEAQAEFERTFQARELPEEMPEVALEAGQPVDLPRLLVAAGIAASRKEAQRLLEQGALELDGAPFREREWQPIDGAVIKVGKRRWLRVRVTNQSPPAR